MKLTGNTILLTGGGSGIGLAFAERFLKRDNTVIIVGRNEAKLEEAKKAYPGLITKSCDLTDEQSRIDLAQWVLTEYPSLNVLVNNAGIQQRVNLKNAAESWSYYEKEITSNFNAPIHLILLLADHLIRKDNAAIMNVTSGLSLTPGVWVPIYSATKAGLRSFTKSLRLQFEDAGVEVIEVLPPAVNTDLGGAGLHTFGAPLDDFANGIFEGLELGLTEIAYGGAADRLHATIKENDEQTAKVWAGFKQNNPDF
ncbi:SDR family oxidoreductase [Bacillus sp. Au-Bac7]|uniref:SDR family oxidoreductase n=1 Tax=Bacillus sp. Au-Bac7 TaxID=2906458 RepID=UPI001E47D568|nr:SDR family NAD(P)-dependent oxidoreductase [Bacillus sp. Au-Bac7]MCE4048071.1 SDR family NAD(P)-dependent oxidoreductase [Bacillus sp. Au-Bac7]